MVVSLRSDLLNTLPTIEHAFTTRQGGVSTNLFSTLNTAFEKGDPDANVMENRRRIAEHLNGSAEQLITIRQTHSNKVIHATSPWPLEERPEGDALVTTTPGLILGIITADCVPVLLADPKTGVIAAVHAGWKGAITGIIQNTLKAMTELGAQTEAISAAIGPCIWQDSYEVDQAFYENLSRDSDLFKPSLNANHWMFDLPGYVKRQLEMSAIKKISHSPADTYSSPELFFSNRRRLHNNEDTFGCFLSCIKIKRITQ
ncbi:peptidoglycan editing factor PgeF [Candidatus Odyssella thessalonicensis]|uniref:peptidoglycan editing factor PgeF n=1 Tax=Candidatus Odyssella thessalonicensis TaxID=84647 RepID=UPI000225AE94|nr:peptidoglycan editing factor PgeF [Candidatus Odyssella thessalonicensis]